MPIKSSKSSVFRKLPEIMKNPSDFNLKNMAYLGRTCFALYNEPTDTKFVIAMISDDMQVGVYALVDLETEVYVFSNDFIHNHEYKYEFPAYDTAYVAAFCNSKLNLDVHFRVPFGLWKTAQSGLHFKRLVNDGQVNTDDGVYIEGHIETMKPGEKLSSVKDVIYYLNETDSWVRFSARRQCCRLYDIYNNQGLIIYARITRALVKKNPSKNIEKSYYAKCVNIEEFNIPYNGLGYNKDFIKIFVEKCANTDYELIKVKDDDPLMSELMRVGCTFEKTRKQTGVSYTFLRIPKANA